jgi:hypothetical protein
MPSADESEDPTRPTGQSVAHSWQATDRFVPRVVVRPLQSLMSVETSSAALILVATVAALVVANSPMLPGYEQFWESNLGLDMGDTRILDITFHDLVNDALMTLFFLLVSLEIKREMVFGELRDPRAAALPIIAAVGGMVVPALIYVAFNAGGPYANGWGIPMATDIAFAVAVLTSLGSRVPLGARLFLLTLAIVDDLGAILVIALFYSGGIALGWLLAAAGTVAVAVLVQRVRVRAVGVFMVLGTIGWFALARVRDPSDDHRRRVRAGDARLCALVPDCLPGGGNSVGERRSQPERGRRGDRRRARVQRPHPARDPATLLGDTITVASGRVASGTVCRVRHRATVRVRERRPGVPLRPGE